MFRSGDFGDKSPLELWKILKFSNFQNFQKRTRAVYAKLSSQTCEY